MRDESPGARSGNAPGGDTPSATTPGLLGGAVLGAAAAGACSTVCEAVVGALVPRAVGVMTRAVSRTGAAGTLEPVAGSVPNESLGVDGRDGAGWDACGSAVTRVLPHG